MEYTFIGNFKSTWDREKPLILHKDDVVFEVSKDDPRPLSASGREKLFNFKLRLHAPSDIEAKSMADRLFNSFKHQLVIDSGVYLSEWTTSSIISQDGSTQNVTVNVKPLVLAVTVLPVTAVAYDANGIDISDNGFIEGWNKFTNKKLPAEAGTSLNQLNDARKLEDSRRFWHYYEILKREKGEKREVIDDFLKKQPGVTTVIDDYNSKNPSNPKLITIFTAIRDTFSHPGKKVNQGQVLNIDAELKKHLPRLGKIISILLREKYSL